jgi:hypothetical protein
MLSRHRRFATRAVLALMLLACGSLAYADSAWDGTWQLNLAKSKFEPGPPLKSQTRTIKTEGDKQTQTIESVAADGTSTRSLSTYGMDGKDYPIKGSADFESLAAKKVDESTIEATLKRAGKAVATTSRTLSKDKKTMTMTTKGEFGIAASSSRPITSHSALAHKGIRRAPTSSFLPPADIDPAAQRPLVAGC